MVIILDPKHEQIVVPQKIKNKYTIHLLFVYCYCYTELALFYMDMQN